MPDQEEGCDFTMPKDNRPVMPITRFLLRWADGDGAALTELAPLIYDDLLRLAKSCLRKEYAQSTLDPTALVHEAYLRLERENQLPVTSRAHFYHSSLPR